MCRTKAKGQLDILHSINKYIMYWNCNKKGEFGILTHPIPSHPLELYVAHKCSKWSWAIYSRRRRKFLYSIKARTTYRIYTHARSGALSFDLSPYIRNWTSRSHAVDTLKLCAIWRCPCFLRIKSEKSATVTHSAKLYGENWERDTTTPHTSVEYTICTRRAKWRPKSGGRYKMLLFFRPILGFIYT